MVKSVTKKNYIKQINLITKLHKSSKRNYLERMNNNKVICMKEAKKYEKKYWDGPRKYGYGGYKYIPGRWKNVAKKIIKNYSLNNFSKILDVGCGKCYLLYEIKLLLPGIKIYGIDISSYAIRNAPKILKANLRKLKAQDKYPYKNKYFDLCISMACLHNLEIYEIEKAIQEIMRVSKKRYLMVESYRNELELFNLQCWALTCETFFSKKEWFWTLNKFGYKGDLELIYF